MNYVIDPYRYFNHGYFASLNHYKVALNRKMRLVKARMIEESQYDRVVIGTSRSMAFNSKFSDSDKPFLNLALAGSGVAEHFEYLRYSNTFQKLNEILYPVDFFSFHAELTTNPDFNKDRLNPGSDGRIGKFLISDLADMLLSLKTTFASIETLYENVKINNRNRQATDTHSGNGGQLVSKNSFKQSEAEFLKRIWFQPPTNKYTHTSRDINSLETFKELCRYIAKHNIKTNFIISPIHVRLQLAMMLGGLRDQYEQWVIAVTRIVEGVISEYPEWDGAVWNFSGVNRVTTEKVPALQGTMHYYVDSSHFTRLVSGMIYKTINNKPSGVKEFGARLRSATIKDVLALETKNLNQHKTTDPDLLAELNQIKKHALTARSRYSDN